MLLSSAARTAYAEAKYGVVVADYPDLRLHSAASKGNIALVQYALSHGQPANSVLDGVLPIHAAAAGGSELVVNLLLEYGVDVNASRLPLKYSHEKTKSSGTIVGTSGCTALHFAAANGHIHIVRLLLSRGADPNKADKHGVTPEDLALELGQLAIADLLRSRNDRNARSSTSSNPVTPTPPSPTRSRILKVQRSIDNVLAGRKSSPSLPRRPAEDEGTSQLTPWIPGQAVVQEPQNIGEMHLPPRRPSLPILAEWRPRSRPALKRPNSFCEGTEDRPVSRGKDLADGYPMQPPAVILSSPAVNSPPVMDGNTLRRLGSKYSLLNIFKKGNESTPSVSPSLSFPIVKAESSLESLGRIDMICPVAAESSGSSPPKSSSTLHYWYRSRKTSEVATSSPLAYETAVGVLQTGRRDGADEPVDSNDDNEKKSRKYSHPFKSIHLRHSSQSVQASRSADAPLPHSPSIIALPLSPSNRLEQSPQQVAHEISRSNSFASQKSEARSASGSSVTSKALSEGDAAEIQDELGEPIVWDRGGDAKSRSRVFLRTLRAVDPSRIPSSTIQSLISISPAEGFEMSTSCVPPTVSSEVSGPILVIDSQPLGSLPPIDRVLGPASWDPPSDKAIQISALNAPPPGAQTITSSLQTNSDLSGLASFSPSVVQTRTAPLVLDSVSSRAEARSLVQKAQEGIIALANYSPDSPIPSPSLAEQLEAYGQTLQLERRFARGEAQKDIKINTSADEAESDGDQENDFIGSPSTLGHRTPPLMSQGVSASALDINRLNRATSLDNAKPYYAHLSYHHRPSEAPRVGRSVIGSLNGPHFLAGAARRRPRPIPNMSSLQHKRSLDARLTGFDALHDDEDEDGIDASGPGDVGARLAKSRLRSNIEIIKTLPTPTESPDGAASAFRQIGDSSPPTFVDDPSTPPPGSPSFDADGALDAHAGSNSENYVPLSRVFTAPSRVTLGQVQYSASGPPRSVVKAPLSPPRSVTDLAPSPTRLGRRFGLRSLVQTLKGK